MSCRDQNSIRFPCWFSFLCQRNQSVDKIEMFRLLTIIFILSNRFLLKIVFHFKCYLVQIERILSLNCYSCSGSSGCADTFNSLASGVTTTGDISSNSYCYVSFFQFQFEDLYLKLETKIYKYIWTWRCFNMYQLLVFIECLSTMLYNRLL